MDYETGARLELLIRNQQEIIEALKAVIENQRSMMGEEPEEGESNPDEEVEDGKT